MQTDRPNPDELLQQLEASQKAAARGRLKIFFGAAAGVGKSYTMLEAAQRARHEGVDVVVGYVELHGRRETEALLAELEILPRREVSYRGRVLQEFDLDAALARKPELLLVDEYAHTNAPESRHPKRWQDVEELLAAGINVWTTVNVQHLESVNDLVAQITGVRVQETLPDQVFEAADEVELVDLPPDELLQRLVDGRVYPIEQALRARENFFREGNLIALRELALRAQANRVATQMRAYRDEHRIEATWAAADRVLVCVGPDAQAESLVRYGKRLSVHLRAPWTVVYVETPGTLRLAPADRERVLRALQLAEQLGAATDNLSAESVLPAVVQRVRADNVTALVIGRTGAGSRRSRWMRRWRGGLADALIARLPGVSVHVVSPGAEAQRADAAAVEAAKPRRIKWGRWLRALGVVAVATAVSSVAHPRLELANLIMVYLAGIVYVALNFGRSASVVAVVASVLVFDFLFVPPRFSFAVSDTQYLITFGVMLLVGLLVSRLVAHARLQALVAGERARRSQSLNELARHLALARSEDAVSQALVEGVRATFGVPAALLLADEHRALRDPLDFCRRGRGETTMLPALGGMKGRPADPGSELAVAQWALEHGKPAGRDTDTLPNAEGLYLPLRGAGTTLAVLAVRPRPNSFDTPEERHLLDAFAHQAAIALERSVYERRSAAAVVEAEGERLRSTLLSGISHDFRTPLTAIIGAATTLIEQGNAMDAGRRRDLAQSILDEGDRMHALVSDLLDLTRMEEGAVEPACEWCPADELVEAARQTLGARLTRHDLSTRTPENAAVWCDPRLIEQALVNLLDNAVRYTPAGSRIDVRVEVLGDRWRLIVADNGPGLPPGRESDVFKKFFRGREEPAGAGTGLGLAICAAVARLHRGTIEAMNDHGARFVLTLPQPLHEVPTLAKAA